MKPTVSTNLETALERTAPTRMQWDAWTRQEPTLAGLTYQDLRQELRPGNDQRQDELLAALVRVSHTDPGAFGVLAACLLPGLRHRIARYAPSLDRQDALAVIVDALYETVVDYDATDDCRFVAGELLALPTRRLRRAVADQRSWNLHGHHDTDPISPTGGLELSAAAMLASAVDAGVITGRDAQLILHTRIAGRSLHETARRMDLGYETAKKRRQRAEARWATWWISSRDRSRREELA
jgi:hypothetical protein